MWVRVNNGLHSTGRVSSSCAVLDPLYSWPWVATRHDCMRIISGYSYYSPHRREPNGSGRPAMLYRGGGFVRLGRDAVRCTVRKPWFLACCKTPTNR